jgi:DNA-binding LytR/AlgR family response regulator
MEHHDNTFYSCVVVEDDESSSLLLKHLVEKFKEFSVIASFSSGKDFLTFFDKEGAPDLLFLDINLPDISGIDLAKMVGAQSAIIFTTAEINHAVDAYDIDAIDYLVKPLTNVRFNKAMDKALLKVQEKRNFISVTDAKDIFIKSNYKYIRLGLDEILYVEALADYVLFHTIGDKKFIVNATMKLVEDKLKNLNFVRIHRSFIVNKSRIELIEDNQVKINNKHLPISKSYHDWFYGSLNTL